MIKKILLAILFLACFKCSWSQDAINDKKITRLYAAAENISPTDTVKYYLVKYLKPSAAKPSGARVIKRVSYNFFIVASASPIGSGGNVVSAVPANALWKAADNLLLLSQKHAASSRKIDMEITVNNNTSINALKKYGNINGTNGNQVKMTIALNKLQQLLRETTVTFAAEARKAHEELAISDIDLGANSIIAVQNNYPGINGQGIKVSVKEDTYDDDLDLLGRSFDSFPKSATTSGHATTMATLIGGNGNSFAKGLGAAPKILFTSSNFINLFPDSLSTFNLFHVALQNHSYGTGIENYYGPETAAYDEQVAAGDSIVHVFSSGNIGTTAPQTGVYNGIAGAANLSGDFKQAKNVLVVGGTGRDNVPEDLSSAGPAYDGRIKPELAADGEDGTSGAAALVSGTVALLQQAYKLQYGKLPSAALIKSVLINSADDIGNAAVDFKTGYGKLNALDAMRTIMDKRFAKGSVKQDELNNQIINVPANCSELKVSIAWNDVPAAVNAPAALVNDLDLYVTTPGGSTVLPWTLSTYPSADSLQKPARRQRDSINNTEQVSIPTPAGGSYVLHVKGRHIPAGSQDFYLAYQYTLADQFEWIYPSGADQFFAGDDHYLRWQSSFGATTGTLNISYDHGLTWKAINSVTLKNKYYLWQAPHIFSTAIFRMDISGKSFVSKEFNISPPLNIGVGFNCSDGTLLHWSPQEGSTGYNIYTIKDNVLQKLTTTADTTIIIPVNEQSSPYFAVSALGKGFEGLKSYTINATTQGVGCYIKTLLATVLGNKVMLDLELGSVTGLKSITWEKMTAANTFTAIGTSPTIPGQLSYQFTDVATKSVQYYRAALVKTDGGVIYSDLAEAIVLQSKQFAVFPNPVNGQFTILSGNIDAYELKLYDSAGKLMMNQPLNNLQNTIAVNFNPGVYVYSIALKGNVIYKGKLVKL